MVFLDLFIQKFAQALEKFAVNLLYTEVINLKDYDPEDKLTDEVCQLLLFVGSCHCYACFACFLLRITCICIFVYKHNKNLNINIHVLYLITENLVIKKTFYTSST